MKKWPSFSQWPPVDFLLRYLPSHLVHDIFFCSLTLFSSPILPFLPNVFSISSSLSPYPPNQGQNPGSGPGPGSSSTPGLGPVTHYYPPQVFQNTTNPINNGNNSITSNKNSNSNNIGAAMNNSTVGQNTASTMDKNIIQNNNFVGSGMSNNTPLLPVTNSWLQQQQPFPSQSIPSSATPSSVGSGTLVGSGVSPHPLTIEGKNPPIMGMGSAPVSGNYMNQSSSPSVRPHGKTLERPVPSVYEWLRWISRPRSLNLNDHIYFSLSQFSYHPFCLLPINPSIHPSSSLSWSPSLLFAHETGRYDTAGKTDEWVTQT